MSAMLVAGPTAGCTADRPSGPPSVRSSGAASGSPSVRPKVAPSGSPAGRVVPAAGDCPVTVPGPVHDPSGGGFYGANHSYGNGQLWVGGLSPDGVITADRAMVQADGAVSVKLGWWRAVAGTLTISGRRLDAAAPPLRAQVPAGYGDRGFQATGVIFPTGGCWEVTGRVGGAALIFHTVVVKASGAAGPA